jgi:hypothetical protein
MDINLYNQLKEHVSKDDINVNFVSLVFFFHISNSGRGSMTFLCHVGSVYTSSSY